MLTCCLLQTAALAALMAGGAQAAAPAPVLQDTSAQSQSDTAATDDGSGLADIVVTAQKRGESLQKTSAAVTSVGGESLVAAGITDLRAAQMLVPSARFQQQNAATEVYIRGVGSTLDYPQVEPSASFNFNGIYIPREAAAVPLFDVDRLEVLPGPQGTLYGRSSLGGAINVSFKRPTREYETNVVGEAGNFGLFHGTIVQNLPIGDNIAIRGGLDYIRNTGYQTSGADSKDDFAARLSALYEPNADFTAYVWGYYVTKNGNSPNLLTKGVDPVTGGFSPDTYLNSNPWNDLRSPQIMALPANPFLPPPSVPFARKTDYDNYTLGAQFDVKLGDELTLTYIPSYLDMDVSSDYFLGAYPGNKTDHFDQQTHELRLAGDGERLKWIVGAYAYRVRSNGTFFFTFFPVSIVDTHRLQGVAAFGQATLSIADSFRLIAGGRFSYDDRIGTGRAGPALTPYAYARNFKRADFKLGVEYDAGPRTLLYATLQTGYQPGTFNAFPSSPAADNEVRSAKLTALHLGFKTRLFDNRLQINSEAFYYDYRDLFASAYNTVLNTNQTFNAAKVEIYGNQLDILFRPTSDDQLSLSVGYLHARNKSFDLPPGTVFPGMPTNYDGLQLQYAPDWTISAGYHHDFQLARGYIRAQAYSRFESSFFADFNQTPGGRQKPYTKTDASLTYFAENGRWNAGVWVKNIEDEPVQAGTAGGSNQPFVPIAASTFLEPPRTFGVRVGLNL